jgi:chromosomal replication initiator protein
MHALENHEALTAEQSLPAVPLYRPTYTPSQLAAVEHQRKFRRSLRRVITITIKPPQPVGDDSFGPIVYPEKPPVPPAFIIHVIQETVAAQYGISRQGLSSDHRYQHLIEPRHVAMYLVKTMTNRSLPAVGRLFGGRHHTT